MNEVDPCHELGKVKVRNAFRDTDVGYWCADHAEQGDEMRRELA